jgi:hypothetical protein
MQEQVGDNHPIAISCPIVYSIIIFCKSTIGSTSAIVIGKVGDRSEKFCGTAHSRIASKKLELQVSFSQTIIYISGLISTFEDVNYRSIRTIT